MLELEIVATKFSGIGISGLQEEEQGQCPLCCMINQWFYFGLSHLSKSEIVSFQMFTHYIQDVLN